MIGERNDCLFPTVIPISGENHVLDLAKESCQSFLVFSSGSVPHIGMETTEAAINAELAD